MPTVFVSKASPRRQHYASLSFFGPSLMCGGPHPHVGSEVGRSHFKSGKHVPRHSKLDPTGRDRSEIG